MPDDDDKYKGKDGESVPPDGDAGKKSIPKSSNQRTLEELSIMLDDLWSSNTLLTEKYTEADERNKTLVASNEQLNLKFVEADDRNKALVANIEQLQLNYSEVNERNKSLAANIQRNNKDINSLSKKVKKCEAEIIQLKDGTRTILAVLKLRQYHKVIPSYLPQRVCRDLLSYRSLSQDVKVRDELKTFSKKASSFPMLIDLISQSSFAIISSTFQFYLKRHKLDTVDFDGLERLENPEGRFLAEPLLPPVMEFLKELPTHLPPDYAISSKLYDDAVAVMKFLEKDLNFQTVITKLNNEHSSHHLNLPTPSVPYLDSKDSD